MIIKFNAPTMIKIGHILKEIRKSKGISQEQMAEYCKITQRNISFIETNKNAPNEKTYRRICQMLEINPFVPFIMAVKVTDVKINRREEFNKIKPFLDNQLKVINDILNEYCDPFQEQG